MAKQSGELEWRVTFDNTTSKISSVPESRVCMGLSSRFWSFIQKAWDYGKSEHKKLIHCFKVGIALCLVSLFYYMRPLYDGVGGNAMWAIFTVVVAFEYTVGATICKCLNRAAATVFAGALGIGVHWIANQSGETFEPIILQVSVFILAAAATFSRFLPSIKAQFDHGALIFIVTFIMVSVSGYRVEKLFELANQRLSTVAIGTSICILTSMFLCPVWAGKELHSLVKDNMLKLADSLEGCVAEYFGNDTKSEASNNTLLCILNSRDKEESLANFAGWEPAHGGFNFGHPWKEYIEVGGLLRSCAYCVDALHGTSIISDTKAPNFLKEQFSKLCIKLSSNSSAVLKEMVVIINTMAKSPKIDMRVEEMCSAVQELENALKELSKQQPIESNSGEGKGESNECPTIIPFVEIVPLVSLSSLLIEIAARTEKIVVAVNALADKATSSG